MNMNELPDNHPARQLASLSPAAPAIDRDALMYQAGWAAAEEAYSQRPASQARKGQLWSARLWNGAACLSTAALVLVLLRPAATTTTPTTAPNTARADRSVAGESQSGETASEAETTNPPTIARVVRGPIAPPDEPENYLALRRVALTRGLAWSREPVVFDANQSGRAASPPTVRSLMREFLGPQPDRGAPDSGGDNSARNNETPKGTVA